MLPALTKQVTSTSTELTSIAVEFLSHLELTVRTFGYKNHLQDTGQEKVKASWKSQRKM